MCWIIVAPKEKLEKILSSQSDRWLDSVWILNSSDYYHKIVKKDLKWYTNYINSSLEEVDWLYILHHRKATIWTINLDNAHPFIWTKFALVQNWTAKDFHKAVWETYKQEVDSHNLLKYIEEKAETIFDIPKVMETFKEEFKDDFWILIITDRNWYILFISDWERESDINIKDDKVISISNYRKWEKEWYKNTWYIVFEYNWTILAQNFKEWINKVEWKKKYYSYLPKAKDMEDDEDYKQWNLLGQSTKKGKKKVKEEDVNRRISNYLWWLEKLIHYYADDLLLEEFLAEEYWVYSIWEYYMTYNESFPRKYFTTVLATVKNYFPKVKV